MPLPKVSVIVVSYNTKEKLRRCLECIEPHHEVIVVDNDSQDGSPQMVRDAFPRVRLVPNKFNAGFGVANNQGCEIATGELLLFLNSDAYAERGAIDLLASVFEDSEVVGAGGRLLNPDGSLQQSTANNLNLWAVFCEQSLLEKAFPSSPLFSPYWTTFRHRDETNPWPTPQLMGASLMIRASVDERFDPRYFLYCEDTDLCLRLSRHGKLLHVPAARFEHDLGSSSSKDPSMGIIRYNRGKELYFRVHHGAAASFACLLLDRLGAALRLTGWLVLAALALGRSARRNAQMKCFWRVLTAPRLSAEGSTRIPGSPRPAIRPS